MKFEGSKYDLIRPFDYTTLDSLIINSAKEAGLKFEKTQDSEHIIFTLKGWLLNAFKIRYNKNSEEAVDFVELLTGAPYGYAYPNKITEFTGIFYRNQQNVLKE